MTSNKKRLHPAGIIFEMLRAIKQLLFGIAPIAIIAIGNGHFLYVALGVSVFALFIIVSSILQWYRFQYAITGDELHIEKGLFIRQKRYISKNRIQSIDLTQNIIHRLLGLTKVQIETAGSDKNVDASLSAVTLQEGEHIRHQLKMAATDITEETTDTMEKEKPSVTISFKRLLVAGSTSASFGVILGLFAVFFSEVETFIPDAIYEQTVDWVLSLAIQIIILIQILGVLIIWLFGILTTVIKYGKFTITREGKELSISRGLLEKKQMTIPLKRIQAVGIQESIVRQPLGFATLYVEIAGGEVSEGKDAKTLLFPILRKKEIEGFLQSILPEYAQVPKQLTRLPKRALPYYVLRIMAWPLLATVVLLILWPDVAFIPAIITVLALAIGLINYKTAGYSIDKENKQLTLCIRQITKDTIIIKKSRIQAIEKKQHIIHRKQKLASIRLSILNNFGGRHITMKEMELLDADNVSDTVVSGMK